MEKLLQLMEINYSIHELPQVAEKLLSDIPSRVFLFYGPMGVGKTTLIKEMARALGTRDIVSSPTFSLVNEYEIPSGLIYHFDFYRLENAREALDFGLEDYLYSGHYIFAEWPEKIQEFLPAEAVKIYLKKNKDGSRTLNYLPVI